MKRTLDHDNLIGWRRRDQDLALSLEEGDPVVITTSPNGHDASAKILTSFSETVKIPKNFGLPRKVLAVAAVSYYSERTPRRNLPSKNGIPNLDLQMVLKKINTPSLKMNIHFKFLI